MAKKTVHVLHPKHDFIIIEKTSSAEFNCDGERDKNRFYAKVKAVGPGKILPSGERAPMSCKVGDVLLIWGGIAETKFESMKLLSIQDEAVFAVVGPETEEIEDGQGTVRLATGDDVDNLARLAIQKGIPLA
jgi:co-chaperonin GroES (HSP10)